MILKNLCDKPNAVKNSITLRESSYADDGSQQCSLSFESCSLWLQARQADGSLLTTLLNLALQYGPVLFKTFFSGDGAQQQTTDRIEELEIKVNEKSLASESSSTFLIM